jgi:hypothetical protein
MPMIRERQLPPGICRIRKGPAYVFLAKICLHKLKICGPVKLKSLDFSPAQRENGAFDTLGLA